MQAMGAHRLYHKSTCLLGHLPHRPSLVPCVSSNFRSNVSLSVWLCLCVCHKPTSHKRDFRHCPFRTQIYIYLYIFSETSGPSMLLYIHYIQFSIANSHIIIITMTIILLLTYYPLFNNIYRRYFIKYKPI